MGPAEERRFSLVMVTLGTGVGGGPVIVDGKIVAGRSRSRGGRSDTRLWSAEETEHCNCGNQGCLEQMASATGLVRLARRYLEKSEKGYLLRRGKLSAKAVFDAYAAGDAAAAEIVEEFAGYLEGPWGLSPV